KTKHPISTSPVPAPRKVAVAAETVARPFWQRVVATWASFWFHATPPVGLHAIRVLSCLLFIAWLLPFIGQVDSFCGRHGWFDLEARLEASRSTQEPPMPIGWSLLYAAGNNATFVQVFYWASLAIFAAFGFGLATRLTSVLTWVAVISLQAS